MFTCPVCYYTAMQYPPMDYNICECCGTEFGLDDDGVSHAELRAQWTDSGAKWFFGAPPLGWSAYRQLYKAYVPAMPPGYQTVEFAARPKVVVAPNTQLLHWNEVDDLAIAC